MKPRRELAWLAQISHWKIWHDINTFIPLQWSENLSEQVIGQQFSIRTEIRKLILSNRKQIAIFNQNKYLNKIIKISNTHTYTLPPTACTEMRLEC